jgi:hypothetical protein
MSLPRSKCFLQYLTCYYISPVYDICENKFNWPVFRIPIQEGFGGGGGGGMAISGRP